MKQTIRSVVLSGLIVLTVLPFVGCADRIERALNAGETIERLAGVALKIPDDLRAGEMVTQEEAAGMTAAIADVRKAAAAFNEKLRLYSRSPPDSNRRAEIGRLFSDVIDALALLNEQGVLHIKNTKAKLRVTLVLRSIDALATTILAEFPPPDDAPAEPPSEEPTKPDLETRLAEAMRGVRE